LGHTGHNKTITSATIPAKKNLDKLVRLVCTVYE
jgi:hypothetical protein